MFYCTPPTQFYYTDGSFTPLDGEGKGNIARAGVFNGPLQVNNVAHLPIYPNILKAKLYTLLIATEHTKCSHKI
jgi:hypothetical protein